MILSDYLHHFLKDQQLDAILISSPHHIRYLTQFFGFSVQERDAFLLITKDKNFVMTSPLYSEAVRKNVTDFTLLETNTNIPYTTHLHNIATEKNLSFVGFEDEDLTVKEFVSLQRVVKKLIPVSLHDLRVFKKNEEIQMIKKACMIGDSSLATLIPEITSGMTELELSKILEEEIRKNNGDLSFPPIVAFGKNAAVPHHYTGNTKLQENDLILIDFGVKYMNYCSDMTRTFFIGKPNQEQENAYSTVQSAQKSAVSFIQKQLLNNQVVHAKEVDKVAREHIVKNNFPPFPHSLGHGIGLEVHESPSLSPRSDDVLEEGMVFSIEPGIYFNNNFGIRIEDLYTIQKNKLLQLTNAPSEIFRFKT